MALLSSRVLEISIHALREEGDCLIYGLPFLTAGFLSTPSARRATEHPLSEYHH